MKKALLLVLSVLIFFGGLETAQRVRYFFRFRSDYWLKYGFVPHPRDYAEMMERHKLNKAGLKEVEVSVIGYDGYNKYNPKSRLNKYRINSFGFRGREIGEKIGYRIVALGGSTTYGLGVEDGFTYPEYLERKLGVEVINAGICEANIDNIRNLFKGEIIGLKPDMIIVKSLANNLMASDNMFKFSLAQKINQAILGKSLFYMTMREKLSAMAKRPIGDIYRTSIDSALNSFLHDEEFYKQLKLAYKDIIWTAKENNIKVVIVKEPVWLRDHNKAKTGMLLDVKFAPVWERLYRLIDEVGEEEGVQVIEIKDIPKDTEYYIDGLHLTAKGNERLANTIAKHIHIE